jgi:hypothetical protein
MSPRCVPKHAPRELGRERYVLNSGQAYSEHPDHASMSRSYWRLLAQRIQLRETILGRCAGALFVEDVLRFAEAS